MASINDLLLKHYADGKFGVPTALPNHNFDPSRLDMWARYQLMPIRDKMGTLQDIEHSGILQITLFVKSATKTQAQEDKAQAIVDWFGTEVAHTINGVQVMIMSSTALTAMPDDKWYMQPISIEYRVI